MFLSRLCEAERRRRTAFCCNLSLSPELGQAEVLFKLTAVSDVISECSGITVRMDEARINVRNRMSAYNNPHRRSP